MEGISKAFTADCPPQEDPNLGIPQEAQQVALGADTR